MIKILSYEPVQDGFKIGYINIAIEVEIPLTKDVKIKDWLVIEKIRHLKKDDRDWFNFPTYLKKDGANGLTGKYRDFCRLQSDESNKLLVQALREAVKAFLTETSSPESKKSKPILDEIPEPDFPEENIPF